MGRTWSLLNRLPFHALINKMSILMYFKYILKRQLRIEFDFAQDDASPDLRDCRNLEDAVV